MSDALSPHTTSPLPNWASTIRPHQQVAVDEIMDAYTRENVVFLDAPTGSGKTLIAELVRRGLDTRGLYVCSDKSLQDQAAKDFPYAKVLKGKANYQTLFGRGSITAEDCNSASADSPCTWCDPKYKCPYRVAKAAAAITEELAIVNTSYLLAEANTARPIVTAKQPFIIADEADQLEGAILGYIGFEVPMYVFRDLRLDAPPKSVRKPRIIAWLQQLANTATEYVRTHELELKRRKRWGIMVADTMQLIDELTRDIVRQKALTDDDPMADDSGRWIRDYNTKTFKMVPVQVGTYGPKKLWRHGKKWLIMSATLISPDVMATELGLPFEYEVVSVPMTFDVANRPVYLAPVANMTYRSEPEEYERMADAICAIIDRHPGERILVHTVSFKNTQRLSDLLLRRRPWLPVINYMQGRDKMDALAMYRRSKGGILLAASMARGVDLRDDDCRVVVIAKVPYPNLSDPRINARLHLPGGQQWFNIMVARDIVQMTGRGVRSETDHAASYILDKQFSNFWRKNKTLLPGWWREAVDMTFNPRKLMVAS